MYKDTTFSSLITVIDNNIIANSNTNNIIELTLIDDMFNIKGSVTVKDDGINVLSLGNGNNATSITSVESIDCGKNTITAGKGDDTLSIYSTFTATKEGLNEILFGDGNNLMSFHSSVYAGLLRLFGSIPKWWARRHTRHSPAHKPHTRPQPGH